MLCASIVDRQFARLTSRFAHAEHGLETHTTKFKLRLQRYDANALFSILADCVALLTHSSAIQRVKEEHRRRLA